MRKVNMRKNIFGFLVLSILLVSNIAFCSRALDDMFIGKQYIGMDSDTGYQYYMTSMFPTYEGKRIASIHVGLEIRDVNNKVLERDASWTYFNTLDGWMLDKNHGSWDTVLEGSFEYKVLRYCQQMLGRY